MELGLSSEQLSAGTSESDALGLAGRIWRRFDGSDVQSHHQDIATDSRPLLWRLRA